MKTLKLGVRSWELVQAFELLLLVLALLTFNAGAQERPARQASDAEAAAGTDVKAYINPRQLQTYGGGGGSPTSGVPAVTVSNIVNANAVLQTNGMGTNTTLSFPTFLYGAVKEYRLTNGNWLRTNSATPFNWTFYNAASGTTTFGFSNLTTRAETTIGTYVAANGTISVSNAVFTGTLYLGAATAANTNTLQVDTLGGVKALEVSTNGTVFIPALASTTIDGPASGNLSIEAAANHSIRFNFGGTPYYNLATNAFYPFPDFDGLLDLGGSDRRWATVYAVHFVGDGSGLTGISGGSGISQAQFTLGLAAGTNAGNFSGLTVGALQGIAKFSSGVASTVTAAAGFLKNDGTDAFTWLSSIPADSVSGLLVTTNLQANSYAWFDDKTNLTSANVLNAINTNFNVNVGNSNWFGGTNYLAGNVAPYSTVDNPTNSYKSTDPTRVFTNGMFRTVIYGTALCSVTAAGASARLTILYTNNGVGYMLPVCNETISNNTTWHPFAFPLSPGGTFQYSTVTSGSAGIDYTNLVGWRE